MIWISIRAANYTDRATRQVGRNITKLQRQQVQLRQQMVATFAAGMMFTTMGVLMSQAMMNIVGTTIEGRRMMWNFNRAISGVTKALGEQLLKIMGPTITAFTNFLNVISKSEPLMRLIALVMNIASTLLITYGIMKLLTVASYMLGNLGFAQLSTSVWALNVVMAEHAGIMYVVAGAWQVVKASIGPAVIVFMLATQLAERFGPAAWAMVPAVMAVAAAIWYLSGAAWSAATAINIITLGAAAAVGVGASLWAHSQVPSYQMGTTAVRKTGLAVVHQGETIISARERQTRQEVEQPTYNKSRMDVRVSIGTVQTKADKEELRPLLLKLLRDELNNKV